MKIALSLQSIFCMGVPPPSAAMRNLAKILSVVLVYFLFISILFTFQDLSPLPLSSFKKSYAASHDTTTKDYLSAGLTKLPSLYLYFALVYLCFLGCWVFVCFKNYPSFHWIHLLMGMLLIMKGLNLLCAAKVQHSIKVTGTPHGWNVLLYIFPLIRTVLLYTVIAISKGWSFQVKIFFMIVIPLQVLSTVAFKMALEVLLEDSFWDLGIWMADNVCQVLLIGFLSRKSLETGQAVKTYLANFILMWLFYIVFIVYSLNVFVYGVGNSVDYNYFWGKAAEIASLVFYIIMFSLFRPFERNEYLVQLNLQVPVVPVRD